MLGAELGLWERAGSSASWWLVDLPSPVALPSHPVCHGRGGGNGLHGPPWALPHWSTLHCPLGDQRHARVTYTYQPPPTPHLGPRNFTLNLLPLSSDGIPEISKQSSGPPLPADKTRPCPLRTPGNRPPPRCEAHDSLCLFVFRFHHGCLEAEKTDAGPRALAPAQGKWDTHVCKESICEV